MFIHEYLIERQRTGDICNQRAALETIAEEWPEFTVDLSQEAVLEGETQEAVKARVNIIIKYLRRKYADATTPVLIVTHFEVLWDLFRRAFANAEFTILEPQEN
jgi:broad specificity phosphatase PhoE